MIAEHVSKLKADVFRSNTWLMLFEDKAKKLKNEISAKKMPLCPPALGRGALPPSPCGPPVQGRCPRRGGMGPEVWGTGACGGYGWRRIGEGVYNGCGWRRMGRGDAVDGCV